MAETPDTSQAIPPDLPDKGGEVVILVEDDDGDWDVNDLKTPEPVPEVEDGQDEPEPEVNEEETEINAADEGDKEDEEEDEPDEDDQESEEAEPESAGGILESLIARVEELERQAAQNGPLRRAARKPGRCDPDAKGDQRSLFDEFTIVLLCQGQSVVKHAYAPDVQRAVAQAMKEVQDECAADLKVEDLVVVQAFEGCSEPLLDNWCPPLTEGKV